jgi:hypothetical protein
LKGDRFDAHVRPTRCAPTGLGCSAGGGHSSGPDPADDLLGRAKQIGDRRARFATHAGLAGAAPVTRQSGKVKAIYCRWAANKHLRDAVTDFADGSRQANPWAADP